ncbi:MAG: hypothetical protein RL179_3011 [Planctomycetota bacterium]|jgi:hypothetical protein
MDCQEDRLGLPCKFEYPAAIWIQEIKDEAFLDAEAVKVIIWFFQKE